MSNGKVLFKTEVKRIRNLRNYLRNSTKLNGCHVILGEPNQKILLEVTELLSKASNLLEEIK